MAKTSGNAYLANVLGLGLGTLGKFVCDMGFSTCTVSLVAYMLDGLLFPKKKKVFCVKT